MKYDYSEFLISESDFKDLPFEKIKDSDGFLKSSTPDASFNAHLNAFDLLKDQTPKNATMIALLTSIELWLKTHISIFRFLKEIKLRQRVKELPLEIYDVVKPDKKSGFEDLKETVGHDLEALVIALIFFSGESQAILNFLQVMQKVSERGPWIESRYNSRRFQGVDLLNVKSIFDSLIKDFKERKIEVFEQFRGQL